MPDNIKKVINKDTSKEKVNPRFLIGASNKAYNVGFPYRDRSIVGNNYHYYEVIYWDYFYNNKYINSFVKIGDTIRAKIVDVDENDHHIKLSIKNIN